jgi:signal transduction histidine kinase
MTASRSGMLHLHELFGEYKDELLEAGAVVDLEGRSDPKAREWLSSFLMDLAIALRYAAEGASTSSKTDANEGDDPGLGHDPIAATRAYGFLHDCILRIATDRGVEVSLAEHRTLAGHVNEAVVRGVEWHMRTQERERHRVAHELRNALGSAKMALTLLRSRADLGAHIRLAEMLDRNLQRLERALDEGPPASSY